MLNVLSLATCAFPSSHQDVREGGWKCPWPKPSPVPDMWPLGTEDFSRTEVVELVLSTPSEKN